MPKTLQNIKDYLEDRLDPQPIINDGPGGSVDKALEEAVEQYNEYYGDIRTFMKNHDNEIDLSNDLNSGEHLRTILEVLPGARFITNRVGTRPVLVTIYDALALDPGMDEFDVHNKFTNAIQRMDFREQIKGMLGLSPEWRVEGNKVYLTNFPETDKVHVVASIGIDYEDLSYQFNDQHGYNFVKQYAEGKFLQLEGDLRVQSGEVGYDGLNGKQMQNRGGEMMAELVKDSDDDAPLFV